MRIVVRQLLGKPFEFDLDTSANLRELQQKIARTLGYDVQMICICNVKNQDGVHLLNAIFHDDPADENLLEFIKSQITNPEINITELTIFIKFNLGAGHYRRTRQNPQGISAGCGLISNPASQFFQSALIPDLTESFSEQISRLDLEDEVPESFLDPVTFKIMDIPVIASDQRTYDLKTLQNMNFISPFSRQQLSRSTQHNLALRAEMEDFISTRQAEAQRVGV